MESKKYNKEKSLPRLVNPWQALFDILAVWSKISPETIRVIFDIHILYERFPNAHTWM